MRWRRNRATCSRCHAEKGLTCPKGFDCISYARTWPISQDQCMSLIPCVASLSEISFQCYSLQMLRITVQAARKTYLPPPRSKVVRALAETILAYNMIKQSHPLVHSIRLTQLQYNRPCLVHFQLHKIEPPTPQKTFMLKEVGFTHAELPFAREEEKTPSHAITTLPANMSRKSEKINFSTAFFRSTRLGLVETSSPAPPLQIRA